MKSIYLIIILIIYSSCNLPDTENSKQEHPRIYISDSSKPALLKRIQTRENVQKFIEELHDDIDSYIVRHETDPEWIISRLQMYWKTKYKEVYVKGMDFSHGAGQAPVPTVRFSGSRDWDTDYLTPQLEDILPYMDDPRGVYLQNGEKEGNPWEWTHPSETGHIIENINYKILHLAEKSAFLYWLEGDDKYASFASDIILKYIEGMHHRNAPLTIDGHRNKDLMGLQTFEVIHEKVIVPLVMSYDFLHDYLVGEEEDLEMIQNLFRRWADQEIKYGVPGNNWNLMQARYITYLALALEENKKYEDGKGQEYYIDQILNQNSRKQKSLNDVIQNFDPQTGIWPEVASYSIMVSDDIIEIYCLIDKSLNNNLLGQYPTLEKAILANFNYLFPNGLTTAYGDAKHARLKFNALELLIAQYRKYNNGEKEKLVSSQLKRFIVDGAYDREAIKSLFQLFYYVEDLDEVPAANSFSDIVNTTFYSPNVSWIVQRNGNTVDDGMMISKNASLGNHSHANGINLELYAKGLVIATDVARGDSYWSPNHREYYSRFPAHNTVIVDGISDYKTMSSTHAFNLRSIYPNTSQSSTLVGDYTYSDVTFHEPATDASQQRLTGSIRTSAYSGYFVDIFRSARNDNNDVKHEYLYHGLGNNIHISDVNNNALSMTPTLELSSGLGDLKGYDYFEDKKEIRFSKDFSAEFTIPAIQGDDVKAKLYMKGYKGRTIFTVKSPPSRADRKEDIAEVLYNKPIPTLIVRQEGEARTRPFVSIIDAYKEEENNRISDVKYFTSDVSKSDFIGIKVTSTTGRVDYIYNDQEAGTAHHCNSNSFNGTFGIASLINGRMISLFLGHGSHISHDSWTITASQDEGGILIMPQKDKLTINAEKPFTLTIPAHYLNGKTILEEVRSTGKSMKFKGRHRQVQEVNFVDFDLTELNNVEFKISNVK